MLAQIGRQVRLGHGLAVGIALDPFHSQGLEFLALAGILHALTDHGQAQVAAQIDDGSGDGAGRGVAVDAGDEGTVDFEAVHGQVAHRGETTPAGAEVVEEDPHPQDAQGAQHLVGGVGVADEGVLDMLYNFH